MSSAGPIETSSEAERRVHRRLAFKVPVECRSGSTLVRTITQNISTGGMYVELDMPDFQPGDQLELEFALPPAEGVSPYPGRATCKGEVLRVSPHPSSGDGTVDRYGFGFRFLDRLRLSYGSDR